MAAVMRSLTMRDLRGRLVFPRLVYTTSTHAMDRNVRRLYRFMILRPRNRVAQLLTTLDSHEKKAEVIRASFEAVAEGVRAVALFLAALSLLILAIARL